ncbi:MAG: hypothetical protein A2W17_01470 [Planctomycetes bacterium RBG_16_41_13]|nr:MAG: hypothetical protein A2W17_01470 [Planctomycetes bacterium RBG_16_41_13]
MSKTKSLILQCTGIFFVSLIFWWWVGREYCKTHPEPIKQVLEIKVYPAKWHREGFLEVEKNVSEKEN